MGTKSTRASGAECGQIWISKPNQDPGWDDTGVIIRNVHYVKIAMEN